MLTLSGVLKNTYSTSGGTDKEGRAYSGKHKIQLEDMQTLKNNEQRLALIDLTVPDLAPYQNMLGKTVSVPVGASIVNGAIAYFCVAAGRVVE